MKKISNWHVSFKSRKELEIARVAYFLVVAVTMSGIFVATTISSQFLFPQGFGVVEALLFVPCSFVTLYIASFVIFSRKHVHLEEEDGPYETTSIDR